jgi:hypothetical protein
MENPFAFSPTKPVVRLGSVFGTPLAVQGWNWLPVNQVVFWIVFFVQSRKKHPAWSAARQALLSGVKMAVLLGSEWCHNLAHVAGARAIGRPVDALRIIAGMPVLLYDEPEHPSITPREHILRSAAGPAFNAVLLLVSRLFQRRLPPASPAREVADVAVGMNAFVSAGALTPIPVFDGGPIAKWSLVACGLPSDRVKPVLSRANRLLGAGLLGAGLLALAKRRWLAGLALALLGALALAAGFGKMDGA